MKAPLLETRNLKAGYLGREVVERSTSRSSAVKWSACSARTEPASRRHPDDRRRADAGRRHRPVQQRRRSRRWTNGPRDGGIGLVTEERLVFTKMSARDNLRIGGGSVEAPGAVPGARTAALREGRDALGCEQQMLALARALSRNPSILLAADELSLDLEDRRPAPRRRPDGGGRTRYGALIVEQHAHKALKYADRMYLMARPDPARSPGRGAPPPRRDRGCLPARHVGDRRGPLERLRRKNKRKQWKRQRVRERNWNV